MWKPRSLHQGPGLVCASAGGAESRERALARCAFGWWCCVQDTREEFALKCSATPRPDRIDLCIAEAMLPLHTIAFARERLAASTVCLEEAQTECVVR